jgi:dehydratase
MHIRPVLRRLGLAGLAVALVVAVTACDPALVVDRTVTYDCQIKPNHILLGTFSDTLDGGYQTTAAQAVQPGSQLLVQITPKPFTMNASTSGGTVSELSNVVWRIAIPANATLATHNIEGWANVGPGTPTATVSGGAVVVTVPGPIPANVVATFPTLSMLLTATGPVGSRIEPKIAGTSYASPGLSLNAKVTGTLLGTLNPSLACFPSPATSLHSILISNDVAAPKITIATPVASSTVTRNSVVPASFTCDDGSGVGVASCVGTVANGSPIDTSTLGARTFTVTATDNEGKVGTKTVTYNVVA